MLKGVLQGSAKVYDFMMDLNLSHSLVKTTSALILLYQYNMIPFSCQVPEKAESVKSNLTNVTVGCGYNRLGCHFMWCSLELGR